MIPIEKNFKILAVGKHKNVELMQIKGGRQVLLTLLNDTVIITQDIGTRGIKYLLFPPIPIIHVNLLQLNDSAFEVQLSPYKKIHLFSAENAGFFEKLLDCKDRLAPVKSSNLEVAHVVEKPKQLFSSVCQPTLFKFETKQWEKLAKCNSTLYRSGNDCWISLDIVESKLNILNGSIKPSSTCRKDSATRVDMVVINQHGIPSRYLLKFPEAQVDEFVELFDYAVCKSVIGIRSVYNLTEARVPEPSLEAVHFVGGDMKLNVKDKNGGWIYCGPVSMRIEKYGFYQRFNRLVISSEYNASVDFADIELDEFMFKNDTKACIICFKANQFTIKLDNVDGLQVALEHALQIAEANRLGYKKAQEAKENERLERERQRLAKEMQRLELEKKEQPSPKSQRFASSLGILDSSQQFLEIASRKLPKTLDERIKKLKSKKFEDAPNDVYSNNVENIRGDSVTWAELWNRFIPRLPHYKAPFLL